MQDDELIHRFVEDPEKAVLRRLSSDKEADKEVYNPKKGEGIREVDTDESKKIAN